VQWAIVEVDGRPAGRCGRGLLTYVGIGNASGEDQAHWLAGKLAGLRIFEDDDGKLNRSVRDVGGGILAVPNFTLMADARKGRRPEFSAAACGEVARPLFEALVRAIRAAGVPAEQGVFGAHMQIRSQADGPVNLLIEAPQSPPTP